MNKLAPFLIGSRKKTGLLFGVPGGSGGWVFTGFGSFQPIFSDRFLQTLFRTLIHEKIIAYQKRMTNLRMLKRHQLGSRIASLFLFEPFNEHTRTRGGKLFRVRPINQFL